MSDIKLFQLQGHYVTELTGSAVKIEKSLQEQIGRSFKLYLPRPHPEHGRDSALSEDYRGADGDREDYERG